MNIEIEYKKARDTLTEMLIEQTNWSLSLHYIEERISNLMEEVGIMNSKVEKSRLSIIEVLDKLEMLNNVSEIDKLEEEDEKEEELLSELGLLGDNISKKIESELEEIEVIIHKRK